MKLRIIMTIGFCVLLLSMCVFLLIGVPPLRQGEMVLIREMAPEEPSFQEEELITESTRPVTAPAFRTVRELKKDQLKRPPSTRYLSHVSDAFTYVTRHVDPLMSRIVTELLVHKPQNVALAMLEYLKWQVSGGPELQDPSEMFKLKRGAEKTDRLYAVRYVTPLLSDLVRDLAVHQPKDIHAYLIHVLTTRVKAQQPDGETPTTEQPGAAVPPEPPREGGEAPPPSSSSAAAAPSPAPPAVVIKSFSILLLGMDGAGKSTLLAALKGDPSPHPKPTVGFRFAKMALDGGPRVTFYDLGGGPDPRKIWSNYYHDVHGIVFVLDSSEGPRWEESIDLLHASLQHKYLAGKPVLVLCNKQDVEGARSPDGLRKALMESGKSVDVTSPDVMVHGCIADGAKNQDTIDPRLDVSLKWLFERVRSGYVKIEERVKADSKEANEEFARIEAAKDRERLKDFIRRACMAEEEEGNNGQQVKEGQEGGNNKKETSKYDCFNLEEGETFLSEEIGMNVNDLPSIAKDIAAAVGYQKHALQMVGNMKNPIAAGKKALEWNEIWKRVSTLRVELGLPEKAPPRE